MITMLMYNKAGCCLSYLKWKSGCNNW